MLNSIKYYIKTSCIICRILLLCIFCLYKINAYGQLTNTKIKQKGFVEIDHISYFTNKKDKINGRNQGLLQLEFESDNNKDYDWFAAVEIREDIADPSRNRVYLDEYYLTIPISITNLRIGKQIITWGQGDLIKPTNNINSIDYSDFIDTDNETIGVLSARLRIPYKKWLFDGIIVPSFTPNQLPYTQSRWGQTYPSSIPNPLVPGNFMQAQYNFTSPELPPNDIRSAQFAGRISGTIRNFDVATSYYYGYNKFPYFLQSFQPIALDTMQINIQKKYTKLQSIGGDFATVIANFGLHGELAYYITEDKNSNDSIIDDPFIRYVIGIDRTIFNLIGNNNLFVLLEWTHELSLTHQSFSSTDIKHLFQNALYGKMQLDLGAYANLHIQGLYNLDSHDLYLQPKFDYQIADGLTMEAMVDILDGKSNTFFGRYDNNKRFQIKCKCSF